jgi:hypothetical protein
MKFESRKKFRFRLIIFALVVLIAHIILIDYSDLGWSENAGNYLGIVSMILLIISMYLSNRYEQKNRV